jgi:hypothetical protein
MRGMRLTTFAGAGRCVLSMVALSAAIPVAVLGQGRPSADLFLLSNDALNGSTPLYGLGFATGGTIGIRLSGAGGFESTIDADGQEGYGATVFGADADLILSANGIIGDILTGTSGRSGVVPYAFAGLGVIGRRIGGGGGFEQSEWERGPSASYGGGVSMPLGDVLGLDASARYRMPFGDSTQWFSGFPRGWEYRVGVKLNLGGSRSSDRVSTTRRTSTGGARRSRGSTAVEQMGTILGIPTSGARGSATAMAVVNTADDYLGVPYVWGGNTPKGFDCSGFTKYVYAKHGIDLPRVSRQQAQVGERVSTSLSALQVGDLLFFAADYSRVDHVAIYIGDNRIIHATASGGEVRYDDLTSDRGQWFRDHMVGARRVTGDSSSWESVLSSLMGQVVKEFDRGDRAPRPR